MRIYRLFLLASVTALSMLQAQTLDNASLTGKYWVRHLLLVASGGSITECRSFLGSYTFSGNGTFTYQGQQVAGAGAASPANGSGTYSVKPGGGVTLSNALRAGAEIRGGLGVGALVGSSTEAGGGVYDLLVAIPAAISAASNSTLSGAYYVSTVEFPFGTAAQIRNSFFRADAAGGTGSFGPISVNGHAVNLGNRPLTQAIAGASYSISGDGSGTATFPLAGGLSGSTQLVNGTKTIYVSGDGMLFLGGSAEAGSHDFIVGMKAMAGAGVSTLRDQFFAAGLRWEAGSGSSFQGSARSNAAGKVVWSRRVRAPQGVIDFTGASNYTLAGDGTGTTETNRVIVGAAGQAFAGNGVAPTDSNNYELYFAIRTPSLSGSGVFLNPHGIVNAASFAPAGSPIAPGQFITLFGTGIAPRTEVASGSNWPSALAGVQVLINNTAAPVYAVVKSTYEQISAVVPFGVTGSTASVVVVVNGARSNTVEVPLSRTSPGVFSMPQTGTGPGAILHPDYSLVSAANPALRNGVVQIFLTGLGAVTPSIADGTAAPVNPLSVVPASVPINVYVGGKRAAVEFKGLAPTLTGLYQVNVRIPADAPAASAVALAIETPDAFHDQVDIAIAP